MISQNVLNIINELSMNSDVETITLGGSMTHDVHDENSNCDIFVYITKEIEQSFRLNIYKKYCSYIELSNQYDCYEDDGITLDQTFFSVRFLNIDDVENKIKDILHNFSASLGYSTCLVEEVLTSRVMFDRFGRFYKLQYENNVPYPEQLKNNIIHKNMGILSGFIPSYLQRIELSKKRNDKINELDLINKFLASYIDIIFAANKKYHPGKKYLINYLHKLEKLPINIFEDLDEVLNNPMDEKTTLVLAKMVNSLKEII